MEKKELFSFLDLTSLNSTDNFQNIKTLVDFASEQNQRGFSAAAVCVFSNFGAFVKTQLSNTNINTAVVAGAFPHGQQPLEVKVLEIEKAALDQVDEIDIVLNRGLFFERRFDLVEEELRSLRSAADGIVLKTILETGELKTQDNIKLAAELAIQNGADFIKTSTGKIEIGATPEAVQWMCEVIKEHHQKTSRKVGIKVSGGVKTYADACVYIEIVRNTLGDSWLNPELFRIGASSLAKELIEN